MQHIKKIALLSALTFLIPAFTYAENITDLRSLISYTKDILNSIIPLLFGLALIGFIWGVIKYIYAASPQKLSEARNYIIFSIIAIAVMLSVWGLALMLKNTFFESSATPLSQTGSNTNTSVFNNSNGSYGRYGTCSNDSECPSGFYCDRPGGQSSGECSYQYQQ